MAEDTGQDRTEAPTAKRLEESRKKGQIPRSKELNTFVTLIVSAALFLFMGQFMVHELLKMMQHQLDLPRSIIFDPATPLIYFKLAMTEGYMAILPLMLILLVADLLTPMFMGGWNFSEEALEPKFSKLNPIEGIKRIVGIQGVVELTKAVVKVLLIGIVAWNVFDFYFMDLMGLSRLTPERGITRAGEIIVTSVLVLSAAFFLLVLIDVPYQLWNHQRLLKMTRQEVRDEMKESEGSPEVKSKIRQMQMQAAQRRMMEAVPSADVIVTNPTHFAVALKYDPKSSGAPVLVAKGVDLIAAQIRNIALANKVTLVAAPALARALYYSTELNQEIPRGLFLAVAQVLAYVFQLRVAAQNGWIKPTPPVDIQVPDEFRQ